jgi:hypothetical protein
LRSSEEEEEGASEVIRAARTAEGGILQRIGQTRAERKTIYSVETLGSR